MLLKKHIDFKCRQVAVFMMLFLNCFLAAAPSIIAFSTNNNGAYLSQLQHNYPGTEDRSHLPDTEEGRIGYPFSLYKKQQVDRFLNSARQYAVSSTVADDSASVNPSVSSSFIVRPAYYTLLFLYNLF